MNLINCPKCNTSKPLEVSEKIDGMIYYHYKCFNCGYQVDLLTPLQNKAVKLWNEIAEEKNEEIQDILNKIKGKESSIEDLEYEKEELEDEISNFEKEIDKLKEFLETKFNYIY